MKDRDEQADIALKIVRRPVHQEGLEPPAY